MVLETIYVARHGFRSNWVVDPVTGTYSSNVPSPTGIASDPSLASYGVEQAKELATHVASLQPPIDVVYSSPFYRCLQTLTPSVVRLNESRSTSSEAPLEIHIENGLGEFYGLARFDHPSPATNEVLATHFSNLHPDYKAVIRPSTNGESIPGIHDRIAYCLHQVISRLDADPAGPKTLLICTHAATMICIGRTLTGNMPEEIAAEDFKCFTCALSKFERRASSATGRDGDVERRALDQIWDPTKPDVIPAIGWQGGKGVKGGWDCTVNGDCSFLSRGEERGWAFSGDEHFLRDPNAFNDSINQGTSDIEGIASKGRL